MKEFTFPAWSSYGTEYSEVCVELTNEEAELLEHYGRQEDIYAEGFENCEPLKDIYDKVYALAVEQMTDEIREFGDDDHTEDSDWKVDDTYACGVEFPSEFEEMLSEEDDEDDAPSIRYQERDPNSISNRSLLDKAMESDMQSDEEILLLREYKCILKEIETDQGSLGEIRSLLYTMSAANNEPNLVVKEHIKAAGATIATRISENDKKLIALEAMPALKIVLERELQKAYERAEREGEEALVRQRERESAIYNKLLAEHQASRQAAEKKYEAQREAQRKEARRHKTSSIKDVLVNAFGGFGAILYFVFQSIVCVLPFVMIGGNFFVSLALIGINYVIPFASPIFWIWGLVCAIKGVQDFWAILYYIVFVVAWLPFYVSLIIALVSKKD